MGKARAWQPASAPTSRASTRHARLDEMMARAADLDTILTDTEAEALLLESTLIRQHRPHYNVLLKDDKSFPFVKLTVQEECPRLSVTRRVRDDGARYVGPFTDVKHLRRTLRDLRRVFPLRTCRELRGLPAAGPAVPLLPHQALRRPVLPAAARVSPEGYRAHGRRAGAAALRPQRGAARSGCAREMDEAAAARRYEDGGAAARPDRSCSSARACRRRW